MWCPYCGYAMRQGYVRLRGQWAALAGVLAVNFEVDDGSGEGSELLPRTLLRSHERAAWCCVRCEAVLVEPKAEYTPPDDADAQAEIAGSSAGARARAAAAADAPTAASTDAHADVSAIPDTPSKPNGNGNGAPLDPGL
jgi:hypothetical protein